VRIRARDVGREQVFLGASTEWPGVGPTDVEIGDIEALAVKYPQLADDIRTFPLPVMEGHDPSVPG
jgi:uncharacterized protein